MTKINKNYYKAIIQYDGTGYSGFQWQENLRTIQGELLVALRAIAGDDLTLRAASRTDTGVHALGQVIKITSINEIDFEKLKEMLPRQIRVLEVSKCEHHFKPAQDCISKEYRYLFTNTPGESGKKRRFIANNPYALNLQLIRQCTELLVGEHNFQNFVSLGNTDRSTVRKITKCELSVINPRKILTNSELFPITDDLDECFELHIVGNGFMKHTIRHLMTALWKVGNGRLTVDEFRQLLEASERVRPTWKLASPKGLFLCRIDF